jgi:long-chain acyl-CoA synthetase
MTADPRRPWLQSYPPGVPAVLAPLEFRNLGEMIERSVVRFGERRAFESFKVGLSFTQVDRSSRDFAAFLRSGLGLQRGDRVALMLPNLLQYPIALFAVLRAGLVAVSVNPLYTARELQLQLKDSGACAIVIFEGAGRALQEALPQTGIRHVVLTSVGELLGLKGWAIDLMLRRLKRLIPSFTLPASIAFRRALAIGSKLPFETVSVDAGDLAFLQYTGGTTGISKGAMLTHANILASLAQMRHYFADSAREGEEVALAALPFYHILALVLNCLLMFHIGGRQLLIANPRDIGRLVDTFGSNGVTIFVGVNTLFNALLNNEAFTRLDFTALRFAGGGGAPVLASVAQRWKALTGRALLEGYGLTEASGAVSAHPPTATEHSGTTGYPVPDTEIEIRGGTGRPLPIGEIGEVHVRGPQVMTGYWQRTEETARVLGSDGFLATGDLGAITAGGHLKIVDRVKDMILVSGFNVYPAEVEDVASGHPGVAEVAAVGIPDTTSGEAIKLFVVRRDPKLSEEDLIAFCRGGLTGYKVPRQVEFRETLPKSPVGKILRRQLRSS